ncbi:unnamed protein product [Rotaria sp. Silwood1]|nr:unnamed protein product [Rotaria sp. Silwood1]CAF3450766.1 unnamed protein product [Rotaria sp. Silwood1]CAF4920056.1 unnamed protein product [Rotaria sp. Silwood1]
MAKRTNELYQLNIDNKKIKYVNKISTLETMSNELVMELFEYFDLYSLYLTFYSLNSRFNSIICHCQVHVSLDKINPLYFTSFIGNFIYYNIDKGRIYSLQSSIPHQMTVLINDIVMDRFILLRSLTLSRCSIDLVIQILNRIEKSILETISITSCKKSIGKKYSLTQHLLSVERYPSLRSIHLRLCARGIVNLTDVEITNQTLNRLEYLSLDKPSEIEDLFHILDLLPNLQSLNSVVNNLTDSFLISIGIKENLSLSRLRLNSSIIQISTLEYLLKIFPNLMYLYLDFSTRSSKLIDSQYWIDLFEKMYLLKQVYIRISIPLFQTNLSHEQVRDRIKLFKRPWLFTRNLINRMQTIRIIINGIK